MKYKSKQALLDDIRTEHDSLCARLADIPQTRWKEVGVWGDEWTLSDLVAHLAEWHRMFLRWYEDGLRDATPAMPAPGYKWSETAKLNRAIWEKHRSRSPAAVRAEFDSGYGRIVEIVEALSPEQLLEPGHFAWTGKHALTSYLGPNTASHYRFAIQAIKRWLKSTAGERTSVARLKKRSQPKSARTEAAQKRATRPPAPPRGKRRSLG